MKKSKLYVIAGVICIALLSFVTLEEEHSNRFEIGKNLDIFTSLYKEVNTYYVDGTQPGELMKTGIDAMLNSLDPYTVYYPESEIEDYKLMTTGQYGGIGARIRRINEFVVVSEPYEGFPAYKAGLRAGDIILQVDGNDVKGKSTQDLSKILKGNPGTSVKLKIERPGTEKAFDVTFKREKVKIKSVPYFGMLSNEVGYVKMTSFTSKVSQEVKEAIIALQKNPKMTSLVFDLRSNPGGLLHEAINTVNLFTKKGVKVVETRGKIEEWTKTYKTLNSALDKEIPMVILVNGGSASASEIVSGALQDFDRAIVMGTNTYGKGLVQTTRRLKYNTSFKVTTAKYYIPSGRCIQAIDYAHKDEKTGKAKKIPDSLLVEFKTANGRSVLDGAGIKPDIEIEKDEYGAIVKALANDDAIFNYATQFRIKNDSIASAASFKLSDQQFNDFLTYLDSTNYVFETATERKVEDLKKIAEKEEYLTSISTIIDSLDASIALQKKMELIKYKSQICNLLEYEIVTRYYHQNGRIENSLSDDPYIKKSIELLGNQAEYNALLNTIK